jgi:glycosyltransferase involved in cell wall biosynthesis
VKVAVVYYQLTPEGGGVHTFTQSIHAALRAAERESRHEFVYYATGSPEGPPAGVVALPAGVVAAAKRRTIQRLRDAQDRVAAPRKGPRTWFERSLDETGAELVWFATNYAEDCGDRPFIFTVFDVEHARQPWFPEVSANGEWELRQHYYTRYIPRATRVIVPNEAGRDQVERYWRIEPDRFLLLGHPTPEFALDAGERPAPPRDVLDRRGIGDRYLLYPAQFWAHKNHATLFDALALLDGYELVCVGSDKGQLGHHRRLAAESGVGDRVHFLGFVDTAELVALYRHAHALTYVSLFGPENLPPLEAMALGCPVVAADVPGAREQLGDAALRVPALDPEAIAAAVRRLDQPAERDRLVAAGRERARAFTAAGYVGGVLEFLDEFERIRRGWR